MTITIEGRAGDRLLRQLETLPRRVFVKIARLTTQETGATLVGAMRNATPVRSGALSRAWGIQADTNRDAGEVTATVGIRAQYRDAKTGKIPNLYAKKVNRESKTNAGFVQRAFSGWATTATASFLQTARRITLEESTR